MRVEYTLPGMQPPVTPAEVQAATAGGPYGPTFKDRLKQFSTNFQTTWRQVLRLDTVPAGPTTMGPPPRPRVCEMREPAEARMQWRRLVERNGRMLATSVSADGPSANAPHKLQRMQALLVQIQQMEDGVISRSLTATRG